MKQVFNSIRKNLVPLTGVLLLSVLFTACKKDNDPIANTPVSGLMAFNLSPDKAALGVSLGGSNLTNVPLNYTSFTGNYLQVFPGARTVEAYDFNSNAPIASVSQTFVANKYYSVFTLGANGTYRNLVVEDLLDSIPSSTGDAFVRFVNAIPDSSASTVTVTKGGTNVITNSSSYAGVSAFTKIAPGDITFNVSNGTTINASRTFAVEKDKVYTVLLVGLPGNADPVKAVQIKYITNGSITP